MQAPKASDSPQHKKRGTAADLRIRLSQDWPRVGTASPPKRENILTPQKATYKGGKPASWLSMLSIPRHFHGLFLEKLGFLFSDDGHHSSSLRRLTPAGSNLKDMALRRAVSGSAMRRKKVAGIEGFIFVPVPSGARCHWNSRPIAIVLGFPLSERPRSIVRCR